MYCNRAVQNQPMLVYLMHVETLPFPLGTLINTSLEIWLEVSGLSVCFPEGYCFSTGVCVSPFLQGNLTSSNHLFSLQRGAWTLPRTWCRLKPLMLLEPRVAACTLPSQSVTGGQDGCGPTKPVGFAVSY